MRDSDTLLRAVALGVLAVLREKRWAYPLFMLALALLIGYQTYQLSLGFSLWFAALTIFDVVVLVLAWHEYRLAKGSIRLDALTHTPDQA